MGKVNQNSIYDFLTIKRPKQVDLKKIIEESSCPYDKNCLQCINFFSSEAGKLKLYLFHLNKRLSSEAVLNFLVGNDFKPAGINELALLVNYSSRLPEFFSIVALGSSFFDEYSTRFSPILIQRKDEKKIDLIRFGGGWNEQNLFLAL